MTHNYIDTYHELEPSKTMFVSYEKTQTLQEVYNQPLIGLVAWPNFRIFNWEHDAPTSESQGRK